jgi:outer membrane protein assembly factor BamB
VIMQRVGMTVLFSLLAASAALGDDWPQFRGPGGDGVANATDLPLSWSEQENVCWKTAIPGRGWSSPVVLGDRVWMTTAIETAATKEEREQRVAGRKYAGSLGVAKTVSLRLIGADRRTGALVHNIEVFHVERSEEHTSELQSP